jgi:hypothetical protein
MADPITKAPVVVRLERMDYVVPLGELHNMSSATIWDADPRVTSDVNFTELAALFPDHHAQIVEQEEQPKLGRPMYFIRTRGDDNLKLWPRCDRLYWFRATFRRPVGHGAPTPAGTA